jgi:hypothetical protein
MGGRGARGRALPQVGWENGTAQAPTKQVAKPSAPTDQIRDAFTRLAGDGQGRWVSLVELRAQLADLPRAEADAALRELGNDDRVRLESEPFRHRIGPAERAAAIHIDGEDRHQIRIYPPDYQ